MFNDSLLGVSSGDETLHLMFDTLLHKQIGKLPNSKAGWTLPGHKYTGPYNDLENQVNIKLFNSAFGTSAPKHKSTIFGCFIARRFCTLCLFFSV